MRRTLPRTLLPSIMLQYVCSCQLLLIGPMKLGFPAQKHAALLPDQAGSKQTPH